MLDIAIQRVYAPGELIGFFRAAEPASSPESIRDFFAGGGIPPILPDYGEGDAGPPVPVPEPDDVPGLRRYSLILEPRSPKHQSDGTEIRVTVWAFDTPNREEMRMIARQIADLAKVDISKWEESNEGFRIPTYEDDGIPFPRTESHYKIFRNDGTEHIYTLEGNRLIESLGGEDDEND